ncbi:hypothetical protein FA95DRAFT_164772 [Auriscalpium vulgare]|uniref:Uncharacterized protein n=1 Tax=Auriscalpium vulgare TaxID=40419 RepID=A0ACB8RM63_9AGAM|nr:hypothetical protein FA95DRAFT_164772 [Auriscalpium vulgare]
MNPDKKLCSRQKKRTPSALISGAITPLCSSSCAWASFAQDNAGCAFASREHDHDHDAGTRTTAHDCGLVAVVVMRTAQKTMLDAPLRTHPLDGRHSSLDTPVCYFAITL